MELTYVYSICLKGDITIAERFLNNEEKGKVLQLNNEYMQPWNFLCFAYL